MNAVFRLGSSDLAHLLINTGAALVVLSGEQDMFTKASKLSAPVAGIILLASAGFVLPSAASPLTAEWSFQSQQGPVANQIDHRSRNAPPRDNRWDRGYGWGYHDLKPRQIRRSLRHRGFRKVRILDRRGPVYIVKARGWEGRPLRLVVDARTAQIIRVRPVHRRHRWQSHW